MEIKYFVPKSNREPTNIVSLKKINNHVDNTSLSENKLSTEKKDLVNVSSDHNLIKSAKKELSKIPDIDFEKVKALRKSLKDGTFDLDINKICDGILAQHRY